MDHRAALAALDSLPSLSLAHYPTPIDDLARFRAALQAGMGPSSSPAVPRLLAKRDDPLLPAGQVDVAFFHDVFHNTNDREAYLRVLAHYLKPGGTLIVANLDPGALSGLDRVRSVIRIVYRGFTGYRTKPPKGFGKNVMTERQLCDLLSQSGFEVVSTETIKDMSRSSSIPIDYIRAVRA